jgi:hypothetical protein
VKTQALVAIAAAATLTLACAYLATRVEAERERADAETDRRLDLQARVDQLERERQGLVAAEARAVSSEVVPPTEPGESSAAQAQDAPPRVVESVFTAPVDLQRELRSRMLQDPAGRELFLAQARTRFQADPDLARELRLTKEQHDKLLDLLAAQALERRELFARMGNSFGGNEFRQLRENQYYEIAASFGEEKAQLYREYEASQAERRQLRQLRGRLDASHALTDDQAAQLMASWQAEGERFRTELEQRFAGYKITATSGTWYGGDFKASELVPTPAQKQLTEQMEAYSRRVIQAADRILTPAQLDVLSLIHADDLARQRAEAWEITGGLE